MVNKCSNIFAGDQPCWSWVKN